MYNFAELILIKPNLYEVYENQIYLKEKKSHFYSK